MPSATDTDTAPDALPAGGTGDSLADTIARLRDGQSAPATDGAPQPDPAQTPATPVSVPVSNGPPPAADATAAPKLDMTRPGYHDHYGGLNSDGDVQPH